MSSFLKVENLCSESNCFLFVQSDSVLLVKFYNINDDVVRKYKRISVSSLHQTFFIHEIENSQSN